MKAPHSVLLPLTCLVLAACSVEDKAPAPHGGFDWAAAKQIAQVDERYLSFNVEMVEVTGGRFWAPYDDPDGERYAYRSPIDLRNQRLRNLTRALGPAYMRVSGTWANSTYFDPSASPLQEPPGGFGSVLTAAQWDGVHRFAQDLDLPVVMSFAVSEGTRDTSGAWTPDNAKQLIDYSKSRGYRIAATEFYNEATVSSIGGLPEDYDAAWFARDLQRFKQVFKQELPDALLLGPSSVGEGVSSPLTYLAINPSTEEMFAATGPAFEAFSYHLYPALSQRCNFFFGQTTIEDALGEPFLGFAAENTAFYLGLRDRYLPGAPLWLTETGGAACGGNPWSSAFLDTFRYVRQLGDLARLGVQVNMHNTLAASDYALLDEQDFSPRPNYWASVLWQRTMGTTVLDVPQRHPQHLVDVFAHCTRDGDDGGVTLLLVNRDAIAANTLDLGLPYQRYTLTSPDKLSKITELNGAALTADVTGNLPALVSVPGSGEIQLPPLSITFALVGGANVAACNSRTEA